MAEASCWEKIAKRAADVRGVRRTTSVGTGSACTERLIAVRGARRRLGPVVAGVAEVIVRLDQAEASSRATPRGSEVVVAGMSQATQCQNPEPVGASGSKRVMAKERVPSGACGPR